MANLKYRLALDLGASSIGWCLYLLDAQGRPAGIRRLGVRIFSDGRDPKSLASLAADRRLARQARRRRDRVLKRRQRLMAQLVEAGLMPADEAERKALQALDPYELRAKGLDQPLTLHEFGRAIFHLGRKRGFRSSRKDTRDADSEKETGKVHAAIDALRGRMHAAGCRTVGEYLAREHAGRRSVRARRSSAGEYVLYLQRAMVEEEFKALWKVQSSVHPEQLTETLKDKLLDTILFQRRLRPVQPGYCLFEPDKYRARLCAPLQQRFRMLQELNNLRVGEGIGERPLTLEERNAMLALLDSDAGPKPVSFAKLARAAGLASAKAFNFGRDTKRTGLKGNVVRASFSDERAFGAKWDAFGEQTQYALAALVEGADRVEPLKQALLALPGNVQPAGDVFGKQHDSDAVLSGLSGLPGPISEAQAKYIASLRFPDDYGSLSLEALARIMPELEREVVTYDEAVRRAGYAHHSQFYDGELHPQLPYYGKLLKGYTSPMPTARNKNEKQYGRIPNPTVHIGLNQVRQLVNALIKRFGHPHEIVIETTREFGLSGQRRRELMKQQKENQDHNDSLNTDLAKLGQPQNYVNRLKLRLWHELTQDDALDTACVYSGTRINKTRLFSDEIEIDHILPFSRSLHDGIGNKILCTRQANREKGNQTPFEAWGHTEAWGDIVERASKLPGKKPQLFKEHAVEDFLGDGGFLARHLNDTAYLSRATKQYLSAICPPNCVWVTSGRLTSLLRGRFRLSRLLSGDGVKNRDDHRHHALDAAVIGLCDRSLVQRVATAAARAEARGENRLLEGLELPWPDFIGELDERLNAVVVSHKPDHGKQAALHNDTNYAWRGEADKKGNLLVGRHVPLDSLKNARDAEAVADKTLREELVALLAPLSGGKDIKAALAEFERRTGVRRVLKEERLDVIPIRDRRTGKPYRYVKGDSNYCYEIFRKPNGRWDGEVISTFDANQRGFDPSSSTAQNGLPLVMRIHKDDVLAIDQEGSRRLLRVAKFSTGMIALVDLNEANVDARTRDKNSGLKYIFKSPSTLQPLRARLAGVNVLGYVNDPGFRG